MKRALTQSLAAWLEEGRTRIGQIAILETRDGWELRHADDRARGDLAPHEGANAARHLANLDDAGAYRPLKTAPNLRHGWRLARPEWGQGYATEGAAAARDFAFAQVGIERLVSIAHPENHASTAVMRKLGMTLERATIHPQHGVPVVVYELAR